MLFAQNAGSTIQIPDRFLQGRRNKGQSYKRRLLALKRLPTWTSYNILTGEAIKLMVALWQLSLFSLHYYV